MAASTECVRARFMNNNLCCSATLSASSEAVGFSVDNLKDENRTKCWKAAGNFEITSSNENLYIDDGAPKTVAITNGQYVTGSALAAKIETDLNAASSGWSVAYSTSTYKFTISHATATLKLTLTTDAIWDSIGYTGAADVVLSGALLADEVRIHTTEYIDVEAGVSGWDVGFIGMITSLGQVMSMSDGSTTTIKANNIPVWTSPPLELSFERNDQGYLKFLSEGTQYKYWRIEINDRTNPSGPSAVSACYLYVGNYLTFTTTNVARGFSKQLVDPSDIQEAQSGRRFFNQRTLYETWNNLSIQLPERSERLAFEQFVYDFGLTNPFFFSIDPGLAISDDLVELTKFVYFDPLPSIDHQFLDRFNIQGFSVREVV